MSDAVRDRPGRLIEFLAVLLLGLATVGSAWCAFQASRWNDEESRAARRSAEAQLESNRLFAAGTQALAYDAGILAQYADALANGRDDLTAFYRESLVRPDFLPVLEDLESRAASGEPLGNLFENEEYLDALRRPTEEADAKALAATLESQEAANNSDDFLLTTLFMASALFFAGVTSSFGTRTARLLLVAAAGLALAVGVSRLVGLPVA